MSSGTDMPDGHGPSRAHVTAELAAGSTNALVSSVQACSGKWWIAIVPVKDAWPDALSSFLLMSCKS
jgi:hypothetical protein